MRSQPNIVNMNEKQFIGKRMPMTLAEDKTRTLWQRFMPRKKEIEHAIDSSFLYSIQTYPPAFDFNPDAVFEKWAAVEISLAENIPEGMEHFVLPAGLYAVFHYKGSSQDTSIFDYIFKVWLPSSLYSLDHRPHFEVLGPTYKNDDPNSEEEIWIPIQQHTHTA
jgi:AraC family transcriptional regulator